MLFLTSLLLAASASAKVIDTRAITRSEEIEVAMRRYIENIIEPLPSHSKRQTPTVPTTGLNATQWNAQTEAACTTSLEALNGVASNPSGMAVCYNLPYLDNSTGVFEADLRMYMISAPTGDFANISSNDVMVELAYNGATVSAVNASALGTTKKREVTSLISWPKMMEKRATVPTLVQTYAFVGQINKNLVKTDMTTATLEKVLVPTVTLTGTNSSGAAVNTSLSSDEATFVSGVFAKQAVATTTEVTAAEVSPPIQTLVVASDAPFVVPGISILIPPIGLVVTSIWTLAFVITVAYGTVGRMQFRDHYRRRTAVANKGGLARI